MSRRIVVEEPCRHGLLRKHHPLEPIHDATIDRCPGGSRTVLEGIPNEWVKRATKSIGNINPQGVKLALEAAVFGETP